MSNMIRFEEIVAGIICLISSIRNPVNAANRAKPAAPVGLTSSVGEQGVQLFLVKASMSKT